MNLKKRADVIYLEQVNQVVIEARRLTLVMAEGRIFLITVHVCMKNIGNPVETRRPRVCRHGRRRRAKTV